MFPSLVYLRAHAHHLRLAHRAGVTVATVSLSSKDQTFGHASMISGLSTTFRTGGAHALQKGAVVQNVAALHVALGKPSPLDNYAAASVSEEIATLRRLLFGFEDKKTQTGKWFNDAIEGSKSFVEFGICRPS